MFVGRRGGPAWFPTEDREAPSFGVHFLPGLVNFNVYCGLICILLRGGSHLCMEVFNFRVFLCLGSFLKFEVEHGLCPDPMLLPRSDR